MRETFAHDRKKHGAYQREFARVTACVRAGERTSATVIELFAGMTNRVVPDAEWGSSR
jgi:hypothetical protein